VVIPGSAVGDAQMCKRLLLGQKYYDGVVDIRLDPAQIQNLGREAEMSKRPIACVVAKPDRPATHEDCPGETGMGVDKDRLLRRHIVLDHVPSRMLALVLVFGIHLTSSGWECLTQTSTEPSWAMKKNVVFPGVAWIVVEKDHRQQRRRFWIDFEH